MIKYLIKRNIQISNKDMKWCWILLVIREMYSHYIPLWMAKINKLTIPSPTWLWRMELAYVAGGNEKFQHFEKHFASLFQCWSYTCHIWSSCYTPDGSTQEKESICSSKDYTQTFIAPFLKIRTANWKKKKSITRWVDRSNCGIPT